jgi:hypothetical protein
MDFKFNGNAVFIQHVTTSAKGLFVPFKDMLVNKSVWEAFVHRV